MIIILHKLSSATRGSQTFTLAKALVQDGQTKGFSPRCRRSWSFRWDLCLKACTHTDTGQTLRQVKDRQADYLTGRDPTLSHIWQAKGLSLL